MKKSLPAITAPSLVLLSVLSLAGCFGGEDGATGAPVDPAGTSGKKIAPGTYVGDYGSYDSTHTLESEFTLAGDGRFQFYWFAENQPFGHFKGSWFQQDSNLHFEGINESYGQDGFFDSGAAIEDDTNLVRQVTDSSFLRKEWTPLRQKPYWIPYRKKNFAPIRPGNYQFETDIEIDSATQHWRLRVELDENSIFYRYFRDSLEVGQERAAWFQHGSILGNEKYEYREYDTTVQAFGEWKAFPWTWMKRTSEVSDTAFWIWSPPQSFLEMGKWEIYRKVP